MSNISNSKSSFRRFPVRRMGQLLVSVKFRVEHGTASLLDQTPRTVLKRALNGRAFAIMFDCSVMFLFCLMCGS